MGITDFWNGIGFGMPKQPLRVMTTRQASAEGMGASQIAEELGIGRASVYRALAENRRGA